MGSRSKETDEAYIAGFLDGDGSLMLQVKTRSDTKRGARIMATICLYQDTRHEAPLFWMRGVCGIGYVSRRKDGISELRINGFSSVRTVLTKLIPYLRFKKKQAQALIEACVLLEGKPLHTLSKKELLQLLALIIKVRECNYKSARALSVDEVRRRLGLTP